MLTSIALVCFAANALLCRYALGEGLIDAASFTSLRSLAGAFALCVLARARASAPLGGRHFGVCPVTYASDFAFAYVRPTAATGALILFAVVQATMILATVVLGEKLTTVRWFGFALALLGTAYLLTPGLEAPPLPSGGRMLLAGFSVGRLFPSGTQRRGSSLRP